MAQNDAALPSTLPLPAPSPAPALCPCSSALPISLYIYLYIYLSIFLSDYLSVHPSFYLSIYLFFFDVCIYRPADRPVTSSHSGGRRGDKGVGPQGRGAFRQSAAALACPRPRPPPRCPAGLGCWALWRGLMERAVCLECRDTAHTAAVTLHPPPPSTPVSCRLRAWG